MELERTLSCSSDPAVRLEEESDKACEPGKLLDGEGGGVVERLCITPHCPHQVGGVCPGLTALPTTEFRLSLPCPAPPAPSYRAEGRELRPALLWSRPLASHTDYCCLPARVKTEHTPAQ